MKVLKALEIIGLGYMVSDIYKHQLLQSEKLTGYPPRRRNFSEKEYSITETLKKVICQKIETIFEDKYYLSVSNEKHTSIRLVVETFGQASSAIDEIQTIYENYGQVTVSDAVDACGVERCWNDRLLGWNTDEEINSFRIKRVSNGYLIQTPKPKQLLDY